MTVEGILAGGAIKVLPTVSDPKINMTRSNKIIIIIINNNNNNSNNGVTAGGWG
jgi:hypothetical protein